MTTQINDYETIKKFGITYYSVSQAAINMNDKAYGNNDGKYSLDEFKFSFISTNNSLFKADATKLNSANSLVNSIDKLFQKYAGEDNKLNVAEYCEFINSNEYNSFIEQYRNMRDQATAAQKTGSGLDIKENEQVKKGQSLGSALTACEDKGEVTGEFLTLCEMAPTMDRRFKQIKFCAEDIVKTGESILEDCTNKMSTIIQKYCSNPANISNEEEYDSIVEKCEEEIKEIQEEAVAKLTALQEIMSALGLISDAVTGMDPNEVNVSEALNMLRNAAGQVKTKGCVDCKDKSKGKKTGANFEEQEKIVKEKIKEEIEIIKEPNSKESEIKRAVNNLQIWTILLQLFEKMNKK